MMKDGSDPRVNIGVSVFVIAICAAVLWECRSIPPGVFEPLGSAPVPEGAATFVILLALIVIGRSILALRRSRGVEATTAEVPPRRLDAAIVFGLTVVYVAAMQSRVTTFAIMTTVYLFLTIGLLIRFERRALLPILITALVIGFGCQYLFTRVFIVDLPGL